jgi:isorenieratene synthase
MTVVHEHLQVNHDFTALHTGMYAGRPTTDGGLPGLVLAGDWVKLPFPAMLMEAAASSGIAAANTLLAQAGLREEPLWSVPPRGLLAARKPPVKSR